MPAPSDLVIGAHFDDLPIRLDYMQTVEAGYPFIIRGAPTIESGGKFGSLLDLANTSHDDVIFDGVSDLGSLVQTGTISFWVKPLYTGSPLAHQEFIGISVADTFVNAIRVSHLSTGNLYFNIYNSAGVSIASGGNPWSPTSGTLYHIEFGWDVTGGSQRLFVNGTLLVSQAGTGTRTATADRMYLGSWVGTVYENEFQLDELLIYDTMRHTAGFTPPDSPADLTESSLILGHHFDYTSSEWYIDYARDGGNRKPAGINGTIIPAGTGKFGDSIDISFNPHASIYWDDAGLVDALLQTGCVSFWYMPMYSGSPTQQINVFYSGRSTVWVNRVSIWHTSSGFLQFYVNNSVGGVIFSASAAFSPSSGQWYHFELNWDATLGSLRAFVDGVQHGSTGSGTGTRSAANNTYLGIGLYPGATSNRNRCLVDELLIYDKVQHTEGFTPPAAPASLAYDTDLIVPADADAIQQPGRLANEINAGFRQG